MIAPTRERAAVSSRSATPSRRGRRPARAPAQRSPRLGRPRRRPSRPRRAGLGVREPRDPLEAPGADPSRAAAHRPRAAATLVTLYAGGNDILDLKTDMRVLVDDYECLVDALATTGASLVLFTGFDIPGLPAPRMFVRRNRVYNAAVRRIARERGAILVDYWRMQAFREPMMWSPDRMHLSKRGHRFLAARVLDILGVPHTVSAGPWDAPEPLTALEWLRDQHRWTADWLLPLVGRKLRRVTLGDHLTPRWPDPVVVPPKGGLRRLARDLGY
ncbi:SGNH/GDSL hydrolase family protein [Rathayibacter oskolensis]|uniref:SGNH/GDSL hydrolase family protein n=1 Tax=Rathayibacter oskolensis TaxID=1891671 RepID=UPI0034677A9F